MTGFSLSHLKSECAGWEVLTCSLAPHGVVEQLRILDPVPLVHGLPARCREVHVDERAAIRAVVQQLLDPLGLRE